MKNLIALLLFAGGFAGWYLHNEKKDTTESLQQSQVHLADLEKTLLERRNEFQRYSAVATIQKQLASKDNELKDLNDKLTSLIGQREAVLQDQQKQRAAIRQALVGKTISLTLTSGRALGQVRIIKVDQSGVSVANATGIIKVIPSELPPDIKQMLLF